MWNKYYQELLEYHKKNNTFPSYKTEIGKWLTSQIKLHLNKELPEERRILLSNITNIFDNSQELEVLDYDEIDPWIIIEYLLNSSGSACTIKCGGCGDIIFDGDDQAKEWVKCMLCESKICSECFSRANNSDNILCPDCGKKLGLFE